MVKVLAFLLSAVAASTVLQEEVDQTGLLQTSKHRSVARAHRWENIISYDEYDCTALMDSKVWCPMDYFKSLEQTFEEDKACVLNSIATLEKDIEEAKAGIAAAAASQSASEQKTKEAEKCTQNAIEAIAKVKTDMDKAAADFDKESTELEDKISELATKLQTVRDLSLKSVGIFDPDLCKESLVQSGRRWGFLSNIVNVIKDVTEDVLEWVEETACDALETHADKVCYKRVEAERKTFNDAINELKKQADSLSNTLTSEKAKLVEAESAAADARADELAALSENQAKHEELEKFKSDYDALLASHKTQLDNLKIALAALQTVLQKFYDEVGKDVFDVMLSAR